MFLDVSFIGGHVISAPEFSELFSLAHVGRPMFHEIERNDLF